MNFLVIFRAIKSVRTQVTAVEPRVREHKDKVDTFVAGARATGDVILEDATKIDNEVQAHPPADLYMDLDKEILDVRGIIPNSREIISRCYNVRFTSRNLCSCPPPPTLDGPL